MHISKLKVLVKNIVTSIAFQLEKKAVVVVAVFCLGIQNIEISLKPCEPVL